ncbi:MAG: DUF3800 domain-containing protein [Anaerolineales bacterium]|nr:DUF3800 domain-containing protein [Anaerolineales bacterium]
MNPSPLRYAFIDESGIAGLSRKSHVFIVAALCLKNPRGAESIVKRAQKKYGSSLASGELKAKQAEGKLITHVLNALSQESIEVFSVIIDRRHIENMTDDSEQVYRRAVTRLIKKLVKRYPRIEVTLDRRYTNKSLRYQLEKDIREGISGIPQQFVLIRQEDSLSSKGLQAVDFIAWSLFQKYERGDDTYYRHISASIADEDIVTRQAWDAN